MKVLKRILWILLISVLTVVGICLIAIQTPAVQTRVTQAVAENYLSNIDGDVSFSKISLRPFHTLIIRDFVIVDKNPVRPAEDIIDSFTEQGWEPYDTLVKAEYVVAAFSLKGLVKVFKGEALEINKLSVRNGRFHLVLEPYRKMNVKRIFRVKAKPQGKPKEPKDLFWVKKVIVRNFEYSMTQVKKPLKSVPEGCINWFDLHVMDVNAEGSNIRMKNGIVTATLEKCSFMEKSGYECKLVSASTAIGNGQAVIQDIHIKDEWSNVYLPHFIMSWHSKYDFRRYLDKVGMDFKFDQTKLSSQSLGYFAPAIKKMNLEVIADGSVYGPTSGMRFDNFNFRTSDDSFSIDLNGDISGLPILDQARFDLTLDNCNTTVDGLEKLVQGVTGNPRFRLGKVRPSTWASLFGRMRGEVNDLDASLYLGSGVGDVLADVKVYNAMDKSKAIKVIGDLMTEDLNLGKILGNNLLGDCTISTTVKADIDRSKGPVLSIESLLVDKLGLKGHNYTDIIADGTLSKEKFEGNVISSDPACDFEFKGLFSLAKKPKDAVYQFYANVNHADLHQMNLDKREASVVSFVTDANFKRSKGQLLGTIKVEDLVLESEEKHEVGNIDISSRSNDGVYRISLTSDFADAEYTGSKPITSFFGDLSNITVKKEIPALFNKKAENWDGSTYDISMQVKDMSEVTGFFKPGLYIDRNTSLGLSVDDGGKVDGWVKSHRIALKENYLKDIDLKLDNSDDHLSGNMSCEEISLASMLLQNDAIRLHVNDNEFGIGFSFENDDNMVNSGEFVARGDVSRDSQGILGVDIGILPSGFNLIDEEWSIMPAEISIRGKSIKVDGVQFTNGDQAIFVDGGITKEGRDTLNIAAERFDLSAVSPFISKHDYRLRGAMTGSVLVTSDFEKKKGILADFLIDSTAFAGTDFGTVIASSIWNNADSSFDIDLENDLGGKTSLTASARYFPADKQLKASADLDKQDITCIKDLVTGVFEEIDGTISGHVEAEGPIDNLDLKTRNGRLTARLLIDYIHVPYQVDGPFHADASGLYFDDIPVKDDYRGTGAVKGGVYWDHFRNLKLGIHIDGRNIEAIAKPESDNEGYYCNAFGTGTVDITGDLSTVLVTVDMFSSERSKFGLLLANSGKNKNTGLLKFKEPVVEVVFDPYEEMISQLRKSEEKKKKTAVDVRLLIHATPLAEAMLEIDKDTGSAITGRGNGLIDADIKHDKPINLKGDYTLDDGSLHMNLMGIASRDFTINEGSSVKFNGDVQESELNIDAIYKTKASLSTLIGDTTSVNSRRNIDCYLKVTGRLKEPKVNFAIDVPDLDPSVKAKVENALSTEDKVQKQVIALLVTNNFLPDEQSGINNNAASSALYSNAANILTNQLNNIFAKLNIPLDLGLNYQQNNRGNDVFDVNVSTQLFNNRVIINGNIGNRQYKNGNNNSEVAGDIDIEIKLDRSGAFRLNLFSHSADQYTNYLDNSQRNGLGVTYQQEFNKISEVFKYMFAGRKKREQLDAEEIQRQQEEGMKTIVIE